MNGSISAILLYSIFAAYILIYVPFGVVGYARAKVGCDRSSPRAMFDRLPPYAQRATWAHQNAFEAFMVYVAAALMAYATGLDSPVAVIAAIAFLLARLLYSLFYILDVPWARSLMFATGQLCSVTLFFLSFSQIQ